MFEKHLKGNESQIPTPETIAARQKLFASATRILDEMNKLETKDKENMDKMVALGKELDGVKIEWETNINLYNQFSKFDTSRLTTSAIDLTQTSISVDYHRDGSESPDVADAKANAIHVQSKAN